MDMNCCIKGFRWEGKPSGENGKLAGTDCYIVGSDEGPAIIILHDLYGWTFANTRLLADHYAAELGAKVYLPDLFKGKVFSTDIINDRSRWGELNLPEFFRQHSKAIVWPQITQFARILKTKHSKIGAIGFCFGGWGVFRLGAKNLGLVDCIATAHPTHLEKDEILNVGVPTQILAPEFDPQFTPELKAYSNEVLPTLGIPYDYQYFPGLEHGFATRGNPADPQEQRGLERAKDSVVVWFRQWLHQG